ncbi:MAG: hypothetical protein H6710_24755 [Myxococcales bacterium]|nr:hypothetical protein [Myxococcales bacterium]MCB9706975.1 hypothetical protein [Myxococcales bacterium]
MTTRSNALLITLALVAPIGCKKTSETVVRPSEMYTLPANDRSPKDASFAITYDARGRGAYILKHREGGFRLCAEPPPDAAANTSASREVNAGAEALVTLKAIEIAAKGNGQSAESAKSEIAEVATRTELVLLMRDALYRICEMNANGVIDNATSERVFRDVLATGRSLGQRDNIGKLVDVLAIVAKSQSTANTPKLIESLVSTIRLIALGDQVMQSASGTDGIVTILIVSALLSELTQTPESDVKVILAAAIKDQLSKLKEQKKALEKDRGGKEEVKAIETEIRALESLGESLKVDENAPR